MKLVMSETNSEVGTFYSAASGAKKRTPERDLIQFFKKRFLSECQSYLVRTYLLQSAPKKGHERDQLAALIEAMANLKTVLDAQRGHVGVLARMVFMTSSLMGDVKRLESMVHARHQTLCGSLRPGRPSSAHGELAFLLFWVLEEAKGQRPLIDQVGDYIRREGALHMHIQRHFGRGVFDSLALPSVSQFDSRWERSSKASLRESTLLYLAERDPRTSAGMTRKQMLDLSYLRTVRTTSEVIQLKDDFTVAGLFEATNKL